MASIYDYKVKTRDEKERDLAKLKGKVVLIVNTATGCGFTPQYEGLEKLYKKYHDKGLEILDFPCDQFGHQAPGTDEEIHNFCVLKYNTSFDQMAKIEVNGDKAEPLYNHLKEERPDEEPVTGAKNKLAMKALGKIGKSADEKGFIKWNFTKFLVDRDGKVVARFAPVVKPEEIEAEIKKLLK